jgi:predicted ATP-binding protein involved in virulence
MKIKKLCLTNFRCFEQLSIEFDERLTVIVAENGSGKTTVLDGIATAIGRFFTKLPKVKGISSRETDLRMEHDEVYSPFLNIYIEATSRKGELLRWSINRKRDASSRTAKAMSEFIQTEQGKVGTREIDSYATELAEQDSLGTPYYLPVIAYYGTNRAILDEVKRRRNYRTQFSRFDALSGALQPDARFKAAFEWFNAMEDVERREQKEKRNFDYRLPELDVVRRAMVAALPVGFSDPRTEIRPLRFVIDRKIDGVTRTLRLSQLSDGYRVVLGLVMDLARRMAQANTSFSPNGNPVVNPLDLPAIVLIDEVDLHLHPRWQQTVLTDLRRVFRNAQFIVTTHSPQVTTSVPSTSIRIITADGVFSAPPGTEGAESSRLLKRIFGVDPRPQLNPVTQELKKYLGLVYDDKWNSDEALSLRVKLDELYHGEEPALAEVDLYIENRKWEIEIGEGKGSVDEEGV